MLIFKVFLTVREPLAATFKETHVVTSPNNIVNKVWKFHKHEKLLWQFSSTVALKITSKMLHFEGFLPLKWRMVAAFSKRSAVTSKKDVVKQDINNPSKSFKNYKLYLSRSSIFASQ